MHKQIERNDFRSLHKTFFVVMSEPHVKNAGVFIYYNVKMT